MCLSTHPNPHRRCRRHHHHHLVCAIDIQIHEPSFNQTLPDPKMILNDCKS